MELEMNLQLFSDEVNTVAGLDSLLDGNTITDDQQTSDDNVTDTQPTEGGGQPSEEPTNSDGGDPNLESSQTEGEVKDEGSDKQRASHNAAMARMRIENKQYANALQQLAKALNIQEKDPLKLGDVLVNMAQEKLAKEANVPVELYKELHQTKEQLAAIQYQQNQAIAKEKFMSVKEQYGLDDKELIAFAQQLDQEGINAITNPNVDLEYEYYKRNREAIEKKRIAQAVEEALRNSQAADQQSTTPSKQQGAPEEPTETKINNVAALNDLLNSNK